MAKAKGTSDTRKLTFGARKKGIAKTAGGFKWKYKTTT